ncbi:MAG TPA: UDP-3-O-(3-hydroxymyristoyl)glucosamine N-acyltransferase [Actinobacteria bacterium]|jgi:UDP-3-O-[3-hydroxymyristoyl] glucosamine N-acyltransferase|nr:UDP-3-O-(3-hydroxymyristoyl)glucosamine N-acyltransferase [Actinomycetales bacterium]HAM21287.1 UDP-3-O-(3-hydroxymyristoyl)glucosamine N-acyltransferase [Actinomycetota bacterium]HMT32114.1 UDP-3-O-(3-hydroxymyristoyl)glucosamine N-acyltransferase [Dermatophilaceae bacterium]HMT88394.1 UDP-3-O-(3-hydroxymyristoyl)glucosamine N-acyltransferase [Dermatophilaceae bacterium]
MAKVSFAEVAASCGQHLESRNIVTGVSALGAPQDHTLAFAKTWNGQIEHTVRAHPKTLFLVPDAAPEGLPNAVRVANPRLVFARVVRDYLATGREATVSPTAFVGEDVVLGDGVHVGHFAVLDDGVVVGNGCFIGHHAVLETGCVLGERVRIGSHTSIGGPGFGFEVEADGTPIRIPHQGGVTIGNDVEIGSHVTIAQGTINPTVLSDHVKIDDAVFIAHNVTVGEGAFIIAGAEVSGGVTIGARAWISPEATIINQAHIGDDALVGLGAAVVKDVAPGDVVAGVPAKVLGRRYPDRTPT